MMHKGGHVSSLCTGLTLVWPKIIDDGNVTLSFMRLKRSSRGDKLFDNIKKLRAGEIENGSGGAGDDGATCRK